MALPLLLVCHYFCTIISSSLSSYGSVDNVLPPLPLDNSQLELPALYVFGDSYVDSGNNNFLPTISRVNYFPYGINFGRVPTGPTTNVRMVVDFLAQIVGLPFPPPMLGMSKAERNKTLAGVNYGFGDSGILHAPLNAKKSFGHVLSFDEQVALFKNTTMDLKDQFYSVESFALYLPKSLFFIHIASNDLGLFWDLGRNSFGDSYPKVLSAKLSKQLQVLYQLGARKFFVNYVSPLGCQPFNINMVKPKTPCFEEVNLRISTYNSLFPALLTDLESSLPESKFILRYIFKLFEDVYASPSSYGPCVPNLEPCLDMETHVFFDSFHISERVHFIWARIALEVLQLWAS